MTITESLQELFTLTTGGRYQGDDRTLEAYGRQLAGRDPALVAEACVSLARRWTGHLAPPVGEVLNELGAIARRRKAAPAEAAGSPQNADSRGLREALSAGQMALRGSQSGVDHGQCPCGSRAEYTFPLSFAGYGPTGPTCIACLNRHLKQVRAGQRRESEAAEEIYRRIRAGNPPSTSDREYLARIGRTGELRERLSAAGMLSTREEAPAENRWGGPGRTSKAPPSHGSNQGGTPGWGRGNQGTTARPSGRAESRGRT